MDVDVGIYVNVAIGNDIGFAWYTLVDVDWLVLIFILALVLIAIDIDIIYIYIFWRGKITYLRRIRNRHVGVGGAAGVIVVISIGWFLFWWCCCYIYWHRYWLRVILTLMVLRIPIDVNIYFEVPDIPGYVLCIFHFPSHLLSSPFFSCYLLFGRNSDPGSRSRLFPPLLTTRTSFAFFAREGLSTFFSRRLEKNWKFLLPALWTLGTCHFLRKTKEKVHTRAEIWTHGINASGTRG